jgi:hypothetical protein
MSGTGAAAAGVGFGIAGEGAGIGGSIVTEIKNRIRILHDEWHQDVACLFTYDNR